MLIRWAIGELRASRQGRVYWGGGGSIFCCLSHEPWYRRGLLFGGASVKRRVLMNQSECLRVLPVEALKPRRFPGFPVPIPNRRPRWRRCFGVESSCCLYCRHLRFGLSGLAWVSPLFYSASLFAQAHAGSDQRAAGSRSPRRTAQPHDQGEL